MPPTGEEVLARAGISEDKCHAIAKSAGSIDVFPVECRAIRCKAAVSWSNFGWRPWLETHEQAMKSTEATSSRLHANRPSHFTFMSLPMAVSDLPIVLVHGDLDILSDEDGHITGVIDWDSFLFLPFGWNSFCLDLFLSQFQGLDNGTYIFKDYEVRPELEMGFWHKFWENAPANIRDHSEGDICRQLLGEIGPHSGFLATYAFTNIQP
jgi:hypothetical protein